jgi:hypothetical protein
MECSGVLAGAGACTKTLQSDVESYVQAGIAPATKRAYRADLDHFRAWGGTIPATEAQVAAYRSAHAETLSVTTLVRRLAAISVERMDFRMPRWGTSSGWTNLYHEPDFGDPDAPAASEPL